MLRRSEGFTTGIMRYKPNKYEIISGTVVDSISAEQKDKKTSMDEDDASLECSRLGCDAFVRRNQDGDTTYYKFTMPYHGDADSLNPELAGNNEIVYVKPRPRPRPRPAPLKESLFSPQDNNNPNRGRNMILLLLFIAAIALILWPILFRSKTVHPEVFGRPGTVEEDEVAV